MCHVYCEEVREQLCGLLFSLSLYMVLGTGLSLEWKRLCLQTPPFPLVFVLHLGQLTPTGVAHQRHLPHTLFFAHRV